MLQTPCRCWTAPESGIQVSRAGPCKQAVTLVFVIGSTAFANCGDHGAQ